ncbi:MAG: ABC transporter substrate-binding protein [Spirochaetales bacterium]|nr:ABC transporter substrate-binding protein [Spirochaetales bacterium]
MKNKNVYCLCLFLSLLLFNSCQTSSEVNTDRKFRIGVLMPESGYIARYGESFLKGIDCFSQTHREYFMGEDQEIELIYYDNQSSNEATIAGCKYLINERDVDFILGPLSSGMTREAIPYCEKAGVPIVPLWATEGELTALSPVAFRIVYSNSHTGYLLSKFSAENLHSKKAAIINDSTAYHQVESSEGFRNGYTELSTGEVKSFDISEGQMNVVRSLAEYKPDVIYLNFANAISENIPLENLIREVEKNDIQAIFLGDTDWSTVDPVELYTNINSEIYYISHHSSESYEESSRIFSSDFREIYGYEPDGLAALGYEALSVVFQFLVNNHDIERDQIVPAFLEGRYDGLLGKIQFNDIGDAFKSAAISRFSTEGSEYITTIKPDIFSVEEFKKEVESLAVAVDIEKQRLSVLELDSLNVDAIETRIVSELIGSSVIKLNSYIVIEAGQRDKIIEEWKNALSGMNEEEMTFEIGKLISARKVISGSIAHSSNRVILNLKLLDIEAGVTLNASFKLYQSFEQLLDNCEYLTYELLSSAL